MLKSKLYWLRPHSLCPRHGHRAQPKGGENCCAIKCVSPPQAPSPFCATGQLYAVCLVLSLGTFYAQYDVFSVHASVDDGDDGDDGEGGDDGDDGDGGDVGDWGR